MSNLAFDTHKFVKDLTRNGMPDKQAEVLADHYASLLTDRLATKEDLARVQSKLESKIEALRKDMMITILSAQLVGIVTICTMIGFMLNFGPNTVYALLSER